MEYLEALNCMIWIVWVAILAITALFIIGAFALFMFEVLPDKIQQFIHKNSNR